MAESIVAFFLTKLSDLLSREASKLAGAEEQLRHLQSELEWMCLVLKHADANCSKTDESFQLFVSHIRDITFSAEDVVDEFVFKLNRHYQQMRRAAGIFTGCLCFATKSMILRDLDNQVRVINGRTEKISANKSRYAIDYIPSNLEASSCSSNVNVPSFKERRLPIVEEVDVIGVKDDIEFVKRALLCGDHRRKVVSIVGMGGLGKTTIARNVYKCNDIKQQFCCRAMIYVSQDYRVKDLLVEITKGVMNLTNRKEIKELEEMGVHDLGSKICDFLDNKKYLVVMDDIWSREAWDGLHSYLPDSNNESRIMITSRNEDLAKYADPQNMPHKLRFLNPVESWALFLRKVFPTRDNTAVCPPELEEMGRKIVGKCGGLPLAIVVLGGLLSRKERGHNSWRRMLDSVNWNLSEGPNSCWKLLALSYNDLPYYLKSCFLYCGLFPEDDEINASKLVHMWVAEGFIRMRGEGTMLEDIAEDYLEELVLRNMIQASKRRPDGGVQKWRIHDLLREFAISKARETKHFNVHKCIDFASPVIVRRLIIHEFLPGESIFQNYDNSKLRSLLCFSQSFDEKSWRLVQGGVKLLTVLDLEGVTNIHTLPMEIDMLIHLKFLGLRNSSIRRLPRSIGKLAELQILDTRSAMIKSIPATVCELKQLRHFYGSEMFRADPIRWMHESHLGVEQLVNLQTLAVKLGRWLDNGGLGKLTQLRTLAIRGELWAREVVLAESLQKLIGLRSLYLHGYQREVGSGCEVPNLKPFTNHVELYKMKLYGRLESLPAAIELYPPNLTKLVLMFSYLEEDPMLTLEKLPNLRFLKLKTRTYEGKKMCCSPGGFPRLLSLSLHSMSSLEEWDVDEGALPVLRYLIIRSCPQMKRFPNGLWHLRNQIEVTLNRTSPELYNHVKQMFGED